MNFLRLFMPPQLMLNMFCTEISVYAEYGCSYGVWSAPKCRNHSSSWRSTLCPDKKWTL